MAETFEDFVTKIKERKKQQTPIDTKRCNHLMNDYLMYAYGQEYLMDNDEFILEKLYCRECWREVVGQKSIYICAHCGNQYLVTSSNISNYNSAFCPDCINKYACSYCGAISSKNLFFRHFLGVDEYSASGNYFCKNCLEKVKICSECNIIYALKKEKEKIRGVYIDLTCPNCFSNRPIARYNWTPQKMLVYKDDSTEIVNIRKIKSKEPLIGIELETETSLSITQRGTIAKQIQEKIPEIYCKSDGSLRWGIELVSVPMSFNQTKKRIPTILKKLSKESSLRASKESSCGMHIHISRKPISNLTLYKMIHFVKNNEDFCFKVSQRKSKETLREYSSFGNIRDYSIRNITGRYTGNLTRYSAINITNENTIEFRFFQGTLNTKTILKNIEFIMGLYYFCKETGLKKIRDWDFVQFVKARSYDYKELVEFLAQRKMDQIENPEIIQEREREDYTYTLSANTGQIITYADIASASPLVPYYLDGMV